MVLDEKRVFSHRTQLVVIDEKRVFSHRTQLVVIDEKRVFSQRTQLVMTQSECFTKDSTTCGDAHIMFHKGLNVW